MKVSRCSVFDTSLIFVKGYIRYSYHCNNTQRVIRQVVKSVNALSGGTFVSYHILFVNHSESYWQRRNRNGVSPAMCRIVYCLTRSSGFIQTTLLSLLQILLIYKTLPTDSVNIVINGNLK